VTRHGGESPALRLRDTRKLLERVLTRGGRVRGWLQRGRRRHGVWGRHGTEKGRELPKDYAGCAEKLPWTVSS